MRLKAPRTYPGRPGQTSSRRAARVPHTILARARRAELRELCEPWLNCPPNPLPIHQYIETKRLALLLNLDNRIMAVCEFVPAVPPPWELKPKNPVGLRLRYSDFPWLVSGLSRTRQCELRSQILPPCLVPLCRSPVHVFTYSCAPPPTAVPAPIHLHSLAASDRRWARLPRSITAISFERRANIALLSLCSCQGRCSDSSESNFFFDYR